MKKLNLKNKILSFCLAIALFVPTILLLSACGKTENYYYTITTPEHCSFEAFSFATDKNGKSFINKGNVFEGSVLIDNGWEIIGTLTLKINGEITEWTRSENGNYYLSFTPTEDFDIVIEGQIVEKTCQIDFKKYEGVEDSSLTDLYIKFSEDPIEETTLINFLNSTESVKLFRYGESIEFWVYTKGYNVEPSVGSFGTFYVNEDKNEYGYYYNNIIEDDYTYEFYGTIPTNISIKASDFYYVSEIDSEKLTMYVDGDVETGFTLHINLENDIDPSILNELTITINNELQNVNFTAGTNSIALKKAYDYTSSPSPYHYTIDLNFYEIEYFNGVYQG